MNQMQGGGFAVMNFGKSKAKRMSVDAPKITFRDVAGVDEAVQELHEIRNSSRTQRNSSRSALASPRGCCCTAPRAPQDAAGSCRCQQGRRAVLLDLRLGLRRDVCRGGSVSGPRPLRAGEANSPASSSWTRSTRSAVTVAPAWAAVTTSVSNAEPAARRDGRLRDERQHHLDRRHQSPRHSGPRLAAAAAASIASGSRPSRPREGRSRSSKSTLAASR